VKALIENDGNLRLVYREWPILGPGSVFAAKAALAARAQGKYEAFHEAMMALRGRANEASTLKVARAVGLDTARLRKDMTAPRVAAHIATSMRLAKALGINGTPSFVVGNTLVPGAIGLAKMKALVARIRGGG